MNRTKAGQLDLSGETFGKIVVLRPVRLVPKIAYEVKCNECGASWSGFTNQDLQNKPKCRNRGCGKKIFRTWKEEHEHEQAEELRGVVTEYEKTSAELAKAEKTCIMHLEDDGFEQSSELRSISMPSLEEAERFTSSQIDIFIRDTPDYYPCPENRDALISYLGRNKIDCYVDAPTLRNAYLRLKQYGLLKERPAPPPPPEPELLEETVLPKPPEPEDDGSEEGYSEETGERIRKSAYLINRMSAEEYLRFKKIPIVTPNGPRITR